MAPPAALRQARVSRTRLRASLAPGHTGDRSLRLLPTKMSAWQSPGRHDENVTTYPNLLDWDPARHGFGKKCARPSCRVVRVRDGIPSRIWRSIRWLSRVKTTPNKKGRMHFRGASGLVRLDCVKRLSRGDSLF